MTQPVGATVAHWQPPLAPPRTLVLDGLYARLEPLSAETHAALLYRAFDGHPDVWTYMPVGPFSSSAQFHRWTRDAQDSQDPQFLAIYNKDSGAFEGIMSYLRINTEDGSIEIGFISMSPALQRTRAATEAIFLTMKWAFENGYRRFEWKCDACNRPSRAAAQRFGLSFEGVFRQHKVVKGRNRDTAWFATIDAEWSALREAYMTWLAPTNFDSSGQQVERLSDLTKLVRVTDDPALRP